MAIIPANLKFFLSGGASNSDPNAALGGAKSSVEIVDDTLNNLFDDVSGGEHAAGDINYRCLFIKNDSAETASNVKVYLESNTPAVDDSVEIGKDLSIPSNTADTIADENTAPSPAVTFSSANGYPNALSIGSLAAGQSAAIWVKRIVVAGSTAQAANDFVLKISIDSL